MEAEYSENIDLNKGKELAIKAIKAAIERDIASGGKGIDIVIITKEGIKKESIKL